MQVLVVHVQQNEKVVTKPITFTVCKLVSILQYPILTLSLLHVAANFCHLLITFANSLDQDQDRHSVGPDPDPNCLTL